MDEIAKCDLVVDQMFSDVLLAGFASEAAYQGKPVIVGGYGLEALRDMLDPEDVAPSVICRPDRLEETIEKLITDEQYRKGVGADLMRYAKQRNCPQNVAERYHRIIDGTHPVTWMCEPTEITYLAGVGMTMAEVAGQVKELVTRYDKTALGLAHRPELEEAYLELIAENKDA